MSHEVCVEGFPPSITEEELRHLFSACGTVLSVDMALTVEGRPMGFATVQMGSAEEVKQAIRMLHHVRLGGEPLLVYRDPKLSMKSEGIRHAI